MAISYAKSAPKNIPASDWSDARKLWEADPTKSFADIGKIVGVSRQVVHARSKNDGWARVANLEEITRRAQERADGLSSVAGTKDSVEAAVDLRSKIIERHREEWKGPRAHFYTAIQNADMEKARLGKTIAEGLKVMQDGERKAWGLDAGEKNGPGSMSVTINRV